MTKPYSKNALASTAGLPGSASSTSTLGVPSSKNSIDFSRYDGSGREPRGVQIQFLDWVSENWRQGEVLAGQLPVGSGKSFLAETFKIATGAHAITPSNILIDQYIATYPTKNYLKGKANYACRSGLTCSDWVNVLEQPPCGDCPYERCKERAFKEPTFFNPLSLYYFKMRLKTRPKVLVVDEAHQLSSMILMLCQKKFRKSLYNWDDRCQSEVHLLDWMTTQAKKLQKLAALYQQTRDYKKLAEISDEIESLSIVSAAVAEDPANFAIYAEKGKYRGKPETFLNVRPVRPPKLIVRRLLDCDKLILLSGTLLPTDIEDLSCERTVRFIDLPSPIPKERRPILYRPTSFPMNFQTDPVEIVRAIERVLDEFPGMNTIIHVSYEMSAKLQPHFTRPVFSNTSVTKIDVLGRFKKQGGVFLAAGCAEGLDLKDGVCRLNIIPRLMYPNLSDPVVQKRKALERGEEWYALETLKVAIQQTGRSTRNESDWSNTVVLDPNFSRLVNRYKSKLPSSFYEAIDWTGKRIFRG